MKENNYEIYKLDDDGEVRETGKRFEDDDFVPYPEETYEIRDKAYRIINI